MRGSRPLPLAVGNEVFLQLFPGHFGQVGKPEASTIRDVCADLAATPRGETVHVVDFGAERARVLALVMAVALAGTDACRPGTVLTT